MPFEVVAGDVLESRGGALVLPVDGVQRGLEGNLARAFAARWPEEWEAIARQVRYPIPLGRIAGFETLGECPWPVVVLASTQHHVGVIDDGEKRRIAISAFLLAIDEARRLGAKDVCLAPLSGGWRLDPAAAVEAMERSWRASAPRLGEMVVRVYRRQ